MWNNVFRRSAEQNSKHPPKTSNQELRKTASQLPRPSFAQSVCGILCCSISLKYVQSRIPKHPPKTANQELRKTASQLPRPSFAPSVCEYAIRSIMISFHYN